MVSNLLVLEQLETNSNNIILGDDIFKYIPIQEEAIPIINLGAGIYSTAMAKNITGLPSELGTAAILIIRCNYKDGEYASIIFNV